ncbi:MAG: NADPH-dependent F420 reductase [Nakamurella sp.]
MTTLGLIGSGNIGSTVARLAVDAGYDVALSNSRGPETLADLVAELGSHARATTATEAAEAGDLVLVTVPLKAYQQVPVKPLAGKVVLDTNNYYPDRDGRFPELDAKTTTTSELLQAHLPESHVVKAFNNIFFKNLGSMARPTGATDRNTLIIAGDDTDSKRIATEFLDAIGYNAYDAGPLADSWRFERDQPAYVMPYVENGDFDNPSPANAAKLEALLARATR